jgi:cytochrome c553
LVLAAGGYLWASYRSSGILAQVYTPHTVDFPIPFPLAAEEAVAEGSTPEARQQMARDRAIERGRHLVSARYPCTVCHGENFGGGVMVDAFPIGSLLAPNITTGEGSRTLTYKPSDWDRIVRHGVLPDGRPAVMPSEDFERMSDQELSDIATYIRSLPAVNNTVPASAFGPLGKVLLATGEMRPSATIINHQAAHLATPPEASVSTEFGQHLAAVCVGCHRPDFSGGPISGGDPAWPPARNLTPAPGALGGWTFDQFVQALRESRRPDGTPLVEPMTLVAPLAKGMRDVELQALWTYLRTLPPVPVTAP